MKTPTRILVVDDNRDDEAVLRRQFKRAGLEPHIKTIHDGGKALDYLTDPRFPLADLAAIFLDLRLPGMDGFTVLDSIRSDKRLQHLPVVIMTSSNSPEELERCRQLGVSTFVSKPLTLSSFAKAFADTYHAGRDRMRVRPMTVGAPE